MGEGPIASSGRSATQHYHLLDHHVGSPRGFKDELFRSRRAAVRAARDRAEWLAAAGGIEVQALEGLGRYLVRTGYVRDPGRTIEVEVCDDPDCEAAEYDRMC
jgi:hypothetical protein